VVGAATREATFDFALRAELAARLREREPQLRDAALARVCAIADPAKIEDPAYSSGLRDAVREALAYGMAGIETPGERPPPTALLAQARTAARHGIALDTVLRRYVAGYTLLSDSVIEEAEEAGPISVTELKCLLRTEAALFERLLEAIAQEYTREVQGRRYDTETRRAQRVRMLLAGELVDPSELGYQLEGWHIGALATGPGAPGALRELAAGLDRRLLAVRADARTLWAWLGGQRKISSREAMRLAGSFWPADSRLALGEPAEGVEGWRFSHRQAKAAIAIPLREEPGIVCYAEVALPALAMSDELLTGSLRDLYLAPLEHEPDGGMVLRRTLREYFASGCNVTSAAAALGVTRQTVSARLRAVEKKLERPIDTCSTELKLALKLSDLAVMPRALR